jgi:hypothetical protein
VNSNFRTLHGFFGAKFQTGSGAFRVFVTGTKLDSTTSALATAIKIRKPFHQDSRLNQWGDLIRALPGGGMEVFAGPIGLRAEIGDDICFNSGAHNNMRVTVGPQLRC